LNDLSRGIVDRRDLVA